MADNNQNFIKELIKEMCIDNILTKQAIEKCLAEYTTALVLIIHKIDPDDNVKTIAQLKDYLCEVQLPKETLAEYRNEFIDKVSHTYNMALATIEDDFGRGFVPEAIKSLVDEIIELKIGRHSSEEDEE